MSGSWCGGRRAAGAELVLVADRGGGDGDLAELHEVAMVADLVGAELVVVAELLAVHDTRCPARRGGGRGGRRGRGAVVADLVVAELVLAVVAVVVVVAVPAWTW